jgi:hypothetical protein
MFTLALLLSTWIPMAFFLAVGSLGSPGPGLDAVKAALLFIGGVHVAATLLLYVDRKFLRLVVEDKVRYVYVPFAAIVGSGLVFTAGGAAVQASALLAFWAWQTLHYGRQNVGVYSFAGIARGWRPHPLERRALDLATLCAVCGTFRVLGKDVATPALHPFFDALSWIGAAGFVGVLVLSVSFYLTHRSEFPALRTALFFTLVLFFLPMFLSTNPDVAFFSYAIAHGTQYLAFMAVVSFDLGAREGRRGVSPAMVTMAALLVLLGVVGYRAADLKAFAPAGSSPILTTAIDFLAGIGLGFTVAHFVIDAAAWRLGRASARRYVTERFGFLFRPGSPAPSRLGVPDHGPGARAR